MVLVLGMEVGWRCGGGVGGGERASQRGETGRGTGWAGGVGSGTLLQFHSGMMEILSGAKPRVEGVW